MDSMTPLLEARSLGLVLGGTRILDGISFSVQRGEFLAIVGPNGAGKTSLLKCLGGLRRPSAGTVLLEGRPMEGLSRRRIARRIAWIPQSGTDSLPFTVREFLLLSRYPWKSAFSGESADDREILANAFRLTELEGLQDRPVHLLSGGERQKALLAAALVQTTDMLFLDEPTSFLDYRCQVEMTALVERVNRERGITVLMVTHDINLALRSADRVLALKGGGVLRDGAAGGFADAELLRDIFDTEFCSFGGDGVRVPYVAPRGLVL